MDRKMNPVSDFRTSRREDCDTSIAVGDHVRSYDFEHDDQCYVEGRVDKIVPIEGCDRYHIDPTKRVFDGEEYDRETFPEAGYFPPVNGVRVAGTFRFTNGVKKL